MADLPDGWRGDDAISLDAGARNQPQGELPAVARPASQNVSLGQANPLFDLTSLRMMLRRNRWLVAGTIAVSLLIGIVITALTVPMFQAASSVQIDQEADRALDTEAVQPSVSPQDSQRFLQTQADVLASRAMAISVARTLGLSRDADFLADNNLELDPSASPAAARALLDAQVTDVLQRNVEIVLPRESRIVTIKYVDRRAARAARIANSYAEGFVAYNLSRKFDSTLNARKFLADQLVEARAKLEDAERQLNAYSQASGLVDAGSRVPDDAIGAPNTVAQQSLSQLASALVQAQADRVAAEGRWQAAQASSGSGIAAVTNNGAYQSLITRQSDLESKLAEARQTYQDNHPIVRDLRAELGNVNGDIANLVSSIRQGVRADYLAAVNREKGLASQLSGQRSAVIGENSRGVQYGILQREADTARSLYDALLQRYKEVSAEAGSNANNVSIVDRAEAPRGTLLPNVPLNIAIALLAGLVLAALLVVLREIFDDKIRGPADIEAWLKLPVVGIVPVRDETLSVEETIDQPKLAFSEAIHALRMTILSSLPSRKHAVLSITSSQAGEGKSTVLLALAYDLARLGRRVLLVDSDLRRPSLHKQVGVANDTGLLHVLSGDVRLDQAVVQSEGRPHLLLTGGIPADPATLLSSPSYHQFIAEARAAYDLVLLDSPPVMGLADSLAIGESADAIIFCLESNHARRRKVRLALRRLQADRLPILGGVLTKFDLRKNAYEYDYGGYYSYDEAREG